MEKQKQGSTEELTEQSLIQDQYKKMAVKNAWENCRRGLKIGNKDLHDFLEAMMELV